MAMISTPFLPVPPVRYGGTELVVGDLCEGLREAGHDVTLFTVGESRAPVRCASLYRRGVWPPDPYHEANHAAWAIGEIVAGDIAYDVIHAHVAALLPLGRFAPAPVVYTLHHDRSEELTRFYAMQRGVRFVAISERQRELVPELSDVDVVYHGVDAGRYPLGRGGEAAAFLGRIALEKGAHTAIDVARAAGVPLLIAGEAHWKDRAYYQREIAPRLGTPGLRLVGEVDHVEKIALLGGACALLFPVAWEEPFGLVMVESMLCGTPVLALPRGSVPEIVDQGVTGFLCADAREMAERLVAIARNGFDRARCRARAVERFGRARMARDYLRVYLHASERALGAATAAGVDPRLEVVDGPFGERA